MKKSWRDRCFSCEDIERLESFAEVVDKGYEELDGDKMTELIRGADGILTCWETPKINEGLLKSGDNLKIICHAAGTIKPHIDDSAWDIIWDKKIVVTNTSAALGIGVAEFTLGIIIIGLKKVFFMRDAIEKGKWRELQGYWNEEIKSDIIPTEPFGITVGVVGAGFCGSHLIKLLNDFEVKILIYDPHKTKEECKKMGAGKVELEYLLSHSDVITLHTPHIPQTENLINKKRMKLIKDGAMFINTAGGIEVNEKALIEELKTGRFYACLDQTYPEPPAADNPLRSMKNVCLTPHIAGHASNGMKRQGRYAVDELERFFKGEEVKYRIKKEKLEVIE